MEAKDYPDLYYWGSDDKIRRRSGPMEPKRAPAGNTVGTARYYWGSDQCVLFESGMN